MVAMTEKFSREFLRAKGLIFFICLFLVLSFLSVSSSSSIFFSTDEECAIHDGSCSSCIESGCIFCLSDVEDGHVFRPEDKLGKRPTFLTHTGKGQKPSVHPPSS